MVERLRRAAKRDGTKPRYTATESGQRGLHPVRAVRHEGAGVLGRNCEVAPRGSRGQRPRHEAGHEGKGPLSTTAAKGNAGGQLWRVPAALLRDDPRKKPETPRCVGADMPLCCLYNAQIWEVHYHAEQGAQSGIAAAERCGSGGPEAESAAGAQAAPLRLLQAELGQRWGGKHGTDCGEPTTFAAAASVPTADAGAARPEPRHAGCGMSADRPGGCHKVLVLMRIMAATVGAK